MLAVDTNVLVRIITEDDAEQSPRARRLVAENEVFISKTVLLELEWVLRRTYRLPADEVLQHLRSVARLSQATVEDAIQVADALDWSDQGMDFADALHLAAATARDCEALASFDRKLAAAAKKVKAGKVKVP